MNKYPMDPMRRQGMPLPEEPADGPAMPQAEPGTGEPSLPEEEMNPTGDPTNVETHTTDDPMARLQAEAEDIQQVFPDFDLMTFLKETPGAVQALQAGRSLWSVFAAVAFQMLRARAESEAMERIRDRNRSVPDVLRGSGAAGNVGIDYAGMPADQFRRLRQAYEAEMRMGRKVRP